MDFDIEVLSSVVDYKRIGNEWNAMVAEVPGTLLGQDGTSTYEWFETILRAFAEAADSRVIVARSGTAIVGILPIIVQGGGYLGPRLLAATELYGGRNGPLLRGADSVSVFAALLRGLDKACRDWISLQMTLLADGALSKTVLKTCAANGYSSIHGPDLQSPYFPLLESAAAFNSGVSKSVRQMLRTSRNKFAKIGALNFREYVEEHQADELLQLVLAIERMSWKHEAGTAITAQPRQEAFYRELFPLAMKRGLLRAEVLWLENEPIAYNFGLVSQDVYACLKHSNVQQYDKLSPTYLVNESLFERLRHEGVTMFDWMGLPEPHKLRWSERNGIYNRNTWTFFNRSFKGRLAAFVYRRKQMLEQVRARSTIA